MEDTQTLLRAWRDAQAALEAATPGTVEWEQAHEDANAAHDAYQARMEDLEPVADDLAAPPTLRDLTAG